MHNSDEYNDPAALPETDHSPEALPPLRLAAPLLFIAAGVLLLATGALVEHFWLARQPWHNAVLVVEGSPDLPGAIPARLRNVPSESLPPLPTILDSGHGPTDLDTVIDQLGLNDTEHVVMAEVDQPTLATLLESGRMPEAGKPEVLAGALARVDHFSLDGQEFQVVGRLKRTTSGFLFAYLLPESTQFDAIFSSEAGATAGYVQPDGEALLDHLAKARKAEGTAPADDPASLAAGADPAAAPAPPADTDAPQAEDTAPEDSPEIVGGLAVTWPVFQFAGMLGLALAAFGGSWAHTRFFRWLALRPAGRQLCVLHEVAAWPRLWAALHLVYFGSFLAMMLLAIENPLWSMRLTQAVSTVFTEGELSYITDAFDSNNVFLATLAIWRHNYITATLLLTFAISIVPFLGAIKTVLSFATVGFAMAPIWTDILGGYWYHSITMVLELEAYILASFTVIIAPLLVGAGFWQGNPRPNVMRALTALLSAVLLSGIMLLIAAFYEAATLLLLR